MKNKQYVEILFRLYFKKVSIIIVILNTPCVHLNTVFFSKQYKSELSSSDDMNQMRRIISITDKLMYMKVLSFGAETLLKEENLDTNDHIAIK